MKKTVLILVALICTIGASAQKYWDGSRADKLFTFGVRAGLNVGKQNALDDQADRDVTGRRLYQGHAQYQRDSYTYK